MATYFTTGTTPSTFVFIGRSGSGKGTQIALLKDFLEAHGSQPVLAVETGNRFRSFIEESSYSANLSKEVMEAGIRQPDFLAVWTWSVELVDKARGNEHFIFDGTPRSLPEALVLDTALNFYNQTAVYIIYLDITHTTAYDRLIARGRNDDTPDNIEKRLAWFDRDVAPVVEWYQNHSSHKFLHIDGSESIETIHQNLLKLLFHDQIKD